MKKTTKKSIRQRGGKGFGSSKKPFIGQPVEGLRLFPRETLLEILRLKNRQKVGGEDVSSDVEEFSKTITHGYDFVEFFDDIFVSTSCRMGLTGVDVTVFHDRDAEKSYYAVLTKPEFDLINTGRLVDRDGNIQEPKESPDIFTAITPVNTFTLILERIDELEEMIPYTKPTLDELIFLGEMDEEFTPLDNGELVDHLRKFGWDPSRPTRIPKQFSKFYLTGGSGKDSGYYCSEYEGVDGSIYYQPQKTRLGWEQTSRSLDIRFVDGLVQVPSGSSGDLYDSN